MKNVFVTAGLGAVLFYHKGFTNLAIATLPATVLVIMWLAVSKQALW